ncbi:MAG: hypothetical protein LBI11_05700 [Streptococcaceae bacterium]|jgi:hypothetical protein|nr:hypothetical protein [Streptococcaceae bacterium]
MKKFKKIILALSLLITLVSLAACMHGTNISGDFEANKQNIDRVGDLDFDVNPPRVQFSTVSAATVNLVWLDYTLDGSTITFTWSNQKASGDSIAVELLPKYKAGDKVAVGKYDAKTKTITITKGYEDTAILAQGDIYQAK